MQWRPGLRGGSTGSGVSSLLDKSLLRQEASTPNAGSSEIQGPEQATEDGEPRFGMLETIREYGTELLQSTDPAEGTELRRRHARYYMGLAEQGAIGIQAHQQEYWLNRFEAEHDNLQAALKWAIEQGDVEIALRIAAALRNFWDYRGYYNEGFKWLTEALALPAAQERSARRVSALIGL